MMASSTFIILGLILFVSFESGSGKPLSRKSSKGSDRKLIVISLDGLMFSQIQENIMPFVTNFYKTGVHCPKMQPVFPTKSLVNHFSMATGLYANSHGLTASSIYDNSRNQLIRYSREMYTAKEDVTPIWTLNELAGKHSIISMWPGAEFEFRGTKPIYYEPFDRNVNWTSRVDKIIPLLKSNETQIDLAMFYSIEPDRTSHRFSANSEQVTESLKNVDKMAKYLSERLDQEGLLSNTDIILMSDHGMETFYFNDESVDGSIIDLNRVVGAESCDMYGSSPVLQVIARNGYNQTEICNKLKDGAVESGNYKVYTDEELEATDWHIRNPARFGPCTVVGEPGYVFQDYTLVLKKNYNYSDHIPGVSKFGVHGYDNTLPQMQAVFMANGPRFKKGVEIPFLQNIDLFHLFARLLKIEHLVADLGIDGNDRRDVWNEILQNSCDGSLLCKFQQFV